MATRCPKCENEGQFEQMGWQQRVLNAVLAGVMVLIVGFAFSVIGIGLPLLVASPIVVLVMLVLPWKRCGRCGYFTPR